MAMLHTHTLSHTELAKENPEQKVCTIETPCFRSHTTRTHLLAGTVQYHFPIIRHALKRRAMQLD